MRHDPLVGRGAELAAIEDSLVAGEARGIALAGVAGVGKSRLLGAALDAARSAGWQTARATATVAARSLPFGALAHLLPTPLPAPTPGLTVPNVLREAAEALTPPEGSKLMVGVDDAHLLDLQSAVLVGHLVSIERVFVVVVVRSGEIAPDAISSLWTEGTCPRIELQPLGRLEFDELLGSVLPPIVSPPTRDVLWDVTRGNPLFLREVVAGGVELGHLFKDQDAWVWHGPFDPSPRLVELIEARVMRASPSERRVMELVAAADSIGLDVLLRGAPADAVDSAIERGLLETLPGDRRTDVRLAHPLYAEVLRARTPPVRGRRVMRWLAENLAATGARRSSDLLRLATWILEGGGEVDASLFVQAALQAIGRADAELGERLARRAMDAGGGEGATLALGESLVQQGRFTEAEELLASAMDDPGPEASRGAIGAARALNLFYHLDDGDGALDVLSAAIAGAADPGAAGELKAARSNILMWAGRPDEGLRLASEVIDDVATSARARLQASMTLGLASSVTGSPNAAIALIDSVIPAVDERPDDVPGAALFIRTNKCAAHFYAGHLREAERCMKLLDQAGQGTYYMRGASLWGLAWILRLQGRPRSAIPWALRSLAVQRDVDLFGSLTSAQGELAQCLALIGDIDGADAALDRSESARRHSNRLVNASAGLARGAVRAAKGELSSAIAEYLDAADEATLAGDRFAQALALHDAARLGIAKEVAHRLADVASGFEGDLVPACAAHALARASGEPDELMAAARAFENCGAMLFAAEAAAAAARGYRDHGLNGSALGAQELRRKLVARCEGASTPALREETLEFPLTAREFEIANLAVRGLTNREIAERLVLSVRTVDNHLHAVYSKLGISGRDELVAILRPRPPAADRE